MPNGELSEREFMVKLDERVKILLEQNAKMEAHLEKLRVEINNLKIKVYIVAGTVSIVTSTLLLILKSILKG